MGVGMVRPVPPQAFQPCHTNPRLSVFFQQVFLLLDLFLCLHLGGNHEISGWGSNLHFWLLSL